LQRSSLARIDPWNPSGNKRFAAISNVDPLPAMRLAPDREA
jgi:hypothetical protein